jgi:hypothetical protein
LCGLAPQKKFLFSHKDISKFSYYLTKNVLPLLYSIHGRGFYYQPGGVLLGIEQRSIQGPAAGAIFAVV